MSRSHPFRTLGLAPSFGFGDRLGLATPGHVAAMHCSGSGIEPIFAQQSIREMSRTLRTPAQVVADAQAGMELAGWQGSSGADADHLKTFQDVDVTVAAGFTFFTIDPSDYVDRAADNYDETQLRAALGKLSDDVSWIQSYQGRKIPLATGTPLTIDAPACLRAAVKYGRAVNHAVTLASHIARRCEAAGQDHEIELSVDETEQPTSLAEHFIIADRCLSAGMRLVSLAPRFIGDLEKGVDYKGHLQHLERSLCDHAAIAEMLGPYKLSLHSGSDKISMYPVLARATQGRFHVKTAGTSYLEALRVAARHDQQLFREIIELARSRYETDRVTYHVSATLQAVPPAGEISDPRTVEAQYLGDWREVPSGMGFREPGRQILHCTFGSVLTHPSLGSRLRDVLQSHSATYQEVLTDHFSRHLSALRTGMP